MRPPGTGRIYRQSRSPFWWIRFSVRGKRHDESTGIRATRPQPPREIERRLRQRIHEEEQRNDSPNAQPAAPGTLTLDRLFDLLRVDYANKGNRTLTKPDLVEAHMAAYFGRQADGASIQFDTLSSYVAHRRKQGAASSTVKNELALLKRAFRLAVASKRIQGRPEFPVIEVRNARQRFLDPDEVARIQAHLDPAYQPVIELLALTGWRKSEALGLQWRHVDFKGSVIRIEDSKNGDPRTFPMRAVPALAALMQRQREQVALIERERGRVIAAVFVHADGRPVRDFHNAWERARDAAGLPGVRIHDLRRAAVRAMDRAGVPQSVTMALAGHRTPDIFRRYRIVNEQDLADGAAKYGAAVQNGAFSAEGGYSASLGDTKSTQNTPEPVEGTA